MTNVDQLLNDLTIVLPSFDVKDLNVETLMTWQVHDLEKQYREDTLLLAFFTLLLKEARHREVLTKDELSELEARIYNECKVRLSEEGAKPTETSIKREVEIHGCYKAAKSNLRHTQHQVEILVGLNEALSRKFTALTMVAAREKAELQAGLQH